MITEFVSPTLLNPGVSYLLMRVDLGRMSPRGALNGGIIGFPGFLLSFTVIVWEVVKKEASGVI